MEVKDYGFGYNLIKVLVGIVSFSSQIVIAITSSRDVFLISGFSIIAGYALDCYIFIGNSLRNKKRHKVFIISDIIFISLLFTYFILVFSVDAFAENNAFELSKEWVILIKENLAFILSISQIGLLIFHVTSYIIDTISSSKKKNLRLKYEPI